MIVYDQANRANIDGFWPVVKLELKWMPGHASDDINWIMKKIHDYFQV